MSDFTCSDPMLLLDRSYKDMASMARDAGWEIDFRQLEPGPLTARSLIFGHSDLSIMRVEFDRSFHQLGVPPAGLRTFGLPDLQSGDLRWNSILMPKGVLTNFNLYEQLDVTNPPGQFGGFLLMCSERMMSHASESCELDSAVLKNSLAENRFWHPESLYVQTLRGLLKAICFSAETEGNAGMNRWRDVFNHDLTANLVRAITGEKVDTGLATSGYRAAALKRALYLMNDDDHMPATVQTLCGMTGTSWSTMERVFQEEFGVGPKAYMKSRRLAAVQKELTKADAPVKVSDIANKWGFWHLGSFAADYQKQFGELPSESLNRDRTSASDNASRQAN